MRTNFPRLLLIVLLVLIYLGFLERVLERMRLSRTQAIFILLAMLLGGLPEIPLGMGLKIIGECHPDLVFSPGYC